MATILTSNCNILISSHSQSTSLPYKSSFALNTSKSLPFSGVSISQMSRRFFLPSVSGIWNAITGGNNNNNSQEALLAIRKGMVLFRQGDVSGSVMEFDRAIELDPRQKQYLWQRGLSLYYLDKFEEGAEQFRIDVAQNPNDTEESIWCFLCEAQLYGVDEARRRFLEASHCFLGTIDLFLHTMPTPYY